ncbi:hypothetical protein MHBO_004533, partial [Bonamia ostreae]
MNRFKARTKIMLTGTPLQSNLNELWTMLNFVNSANFSDPALFSDNSKVAEIIKPFILRRLKKDVAEKIPPKKETIIEVELTRIQKEYYKKVLLMYKDTLAKDENRNLPKLVNIAMQLRKVCNHPYLLEVV